MTPTERGEQIREALEAARNIGECVGPEHHLCRMDAENKARAAADLLPVGALVLLPDEAEKVRSFMLRHDEVDRSNHGKLDEALALLSPEAKR